MGMVCYVMGSRCCGWGRSSARRYRSLFMSSVRKVLQARESLLLLK